MTRRNHRNKGVLRSGRYAKPHKELTMKCPSVKHNLSPKLLAAAIFTVVAGFSGTYAAAQSTGVADAQERYRADVERCRSGQTSQDERTCLREAGAALEEARRNRLVTGNASFDENQRARCDRLTGTRQDDCLRLMSDPGAVTHGSVAGGGIIRETTITIPANNVTPAGTAPTYDSGLTPASPPPAGGGLMPAPAPAPAPTLAE